MKNNQNPATAHHTVMTARRPDNISSSILVRGRSIRSMARSCRRLRRPLPRKDSHFCHFGGFLYIYVCMHTYVFINKNIHTCIFIPTNPPHIHIHVYLPFSHSAPSYTYTQAQSVHCVLQKVRERVVSWGRTHALHTYSLIMHTNTHTHTHTHTHTYTHMHTTHTHRHTYTYT